MKKTNEMAIELMSSRFAKFVREKMEEVQSQSSKSFGIFAGQALASMAIEFLKIGNIRPIYNDLDIFQVLGKHDMSNATNRYKNIETSIVNKASLFSEKKLDLDFNESISGIYLQSTYQTEEDEYCEVNRELSKNSSMIIFHTLRKEMVNYVYLINTKNKVAIDLNEETIDLVDSFDINSTQIGINLITNKVYFTGNFLYFLKNRQLEIVNFSTPAHSLIRLFKKAEELEVYFDKKESIDTYSMQAYLHNKLDKDVSIKIKEAKDNCVSYIEKINNGRNLFFGKAHLEKLKGADLSEYFQVKKVVNHMNEDRNQETDIYLTALPVNYDNLYMIDLKDDKDYFMIMINKIEESKYIKSGMSGKVGNMIKDLTCSVNESLSNGNIGYYAGQKIDTFMVGASALRKTLNNLRESKYSSFTVEFERSNCIDKITLDHTKFNDFNNLGLNKMNNLIEKHTEIRETFKDKYIFEAGYLYSAIKTIEKEFGKLIYPIISSDHRLISILNTVSSNNYEIVVEKSISRINKIMEDNSAIFNENPYIEELKNCTLVELNSTSDLIEEGSYQNNCIGGYTELVKSGEIKIISVRFKDSNRRISISMKSKLVYTVPREDLYEKDKYANLRELRSVLEVSYKRWSFDQVKDSNNKPSTFENIKEILMIIAGRFNIPIIRKSEMLDNEIVEKFIDCKNGEKLINITDTEVRYLIDHYVGSEYGIKGLAEIMTKSNNDKIHLDDFNKNELRTIKFIKDGDKTKVISEEYLGDIPF